MPHAHLAICICDMRFSENKSDGHVMPVSIIRIYLLNDLYARALSIRLTPSAPNLMSPCAERGCSTFRFDDSDEILFHSIVFDLFENIRYNKIMETWYIWRISNRNRSRKLLRTFYIKVYACDEYASFKIFHLILSISSFCLQYRIILNLLRYK